MIELCDFSIGYAEKRLLDKVDAYGKIALSKEDS